MDYIGTIVEHYVSIADIMAICKTHRNLWYLISKINFN